MKKVISLILSLVMIFSIIAGFNLTAIADDEDVLTYGDYEYCIQEDDSLKITGYTGNQTTLNIPSTINGKKVTSIGDSAFEDCENLENVTIPNSITSIGEDAFNNTAYYNDDSNWDDGVLYISNCLIYTNNDFESVTDYKIKDGTRLIADWAFEAYFPIELTLTSITIPNSVINIGVGAFWNCTNLTNITIPNSVKNIGVRAFEDCTSLKSITIPDSVTSINNGLFSNCTSLTDLTIPSSVTSIAYDALSDTGYYNDKSKWNNGVLYISNCLIDTNNDFNSVTDYKIKSDTRIIADGAFSNCTNLTNVTIPNSVTSIGNSVFFNCTSLKNITIPYSVKSIGNHVFEVCESLANINVEESNSKYSSWDGVLFNKDKTELIQYPIGNERKSYNIPNSVTSIGYRAFFACESLTNVTIPNGVTNIGDDAFCGCKSLTSVIIPNGVTNIGEGSFDACTSLTNITIPNSVKSIGYQAFYGCKNLTNITIPSSVISMGDYAFENCYFTPNNYVNNSACKDTGATIVDSDVDGFCVKDNVLVNMRSNYAVGEVTIPNGVTSIGDYAFYGCESLASITIPDSVTNIGSAFFDCTSLTSIEVLDNNKNYSSIDGVLFNKDKTELITYPAGKTASEYAIPNSVTSIGRYAFDHCESLASVTIPNSVTNIGDYAFLDCTSLTSITIPNTVTIIGNGAFMGCTNFKDVYYTGSKEEWDKVSICEFNDDLTKATIHYDYIVDGPTPQPPTPSQPVTPPSNQQPEVPSVTQPTTPATAPTTQATTTVSKPKSTKIKKATGSKKAIALTWAKVSGVKGYEVQVAADKKFKKNKKTVTIKKQKTTKTTVKKLKAKKKYYVRVRTYKTVNGKKVYSSWSKIKTVKTN